MLSYESTLARLHSRRFCRLSSSNSHSTSVGLKYVSILFILLLFASASEGQKQTRTSLTSSSPSSNVFNSPAINVQSARRRTSSSSTPISSTTITNTKISTSSDIIQNRTLNDTEKNVIRSPISLIVIITVCSLMTIVTILGNLVVILAVILVRKLQTASNILIVSLAVSDILVGLVVMPLAMIYEVNNGIWTLGEVMCDVWTSIDVLLCTSSILNFLVISIDRYCIINHPFKYAPMRKAKLLLFLITTVWIFSGLVSLPPILGWGRPSKSIPICQVNDTLAYQAFATMLSFYIPLVLVLIIYANIYRTARTATDNRSSVQMSQFFTHNNSSNNIHPPPVVAQQQTNGNSYSSPQSLLNVSNSNQSDEAATHLNSEQRESGQRTIKFSTTNNNEGKSRNFLSPSRCLGRRISAPFNGRLSVFVTRRYSLFRHVHLPNQKAIRTLGVILGTFIVCWLPFMAFAVIKPLYKTIHEMYGEEKLLKYPPIVDSVLLWFGYLSSMLNPLIYSKFNREFRTPFREILCCRCRGLNEKIRRQEYLENLYGDHHVTVSGPVNVHHQQAATSLVRGSGNLVAAV